MIAIADEPSDQVRAVMSQHGARYWIGVDNDQSTLRRYAEEGSLGLPQYYLVDVDGQVVSSGLPSAEQIEAQLQRVFEPALGRALHAGLAEACADYERGAAGAAWLAAAKALADPDETLAKDAAFLREKVEKYAAWQRERIERVLGQRRWADAMGELLLFEARFAGMGSAAWAKEQLATVAKEPDIHADRFAWDKLRKALAKEMKGVSSASARKSAVFAYSAIVKAHASSPAAKIATDRIQALGGE